jgi:hypothetical protein
MSVPSLSLERQKELVAIWRETGRLLEAQKHAELAAQSPAESRQAAFDMLQLGGMLPRDIARENSSGLVEMQRYFARWRSRGRA